MRMRPVTWRRATGGYTMAERWVVGFADETTCFVKSGAGNVAMSLRTEYELVYARMTAPFLPALIAWDDNGESPILVLEDLSAAQWPPPWNQRRVDAVLSGLDMLQNYRDVLTGLPSLAVSHDEELRLNWHRIEEDPAAFLSLGLSSARWLASALPSLQEASVVAPLNGDAVLHWDVRSDNLCFRGDQAVFIDWNHVRLGNRSADVAAWLPSLHSEGGPSPEEVHDLSACWPAAIAGYFALRAGLPRIPEAPAARTVQLSQLRSALPWAQRALGLPPLDGPNAR